jgi:isopentenyl phosphate kinase
MAHQALVFVKLGGSVITEKTEPETPRPDVIRRLAGEIAAALGARPGLRLVLGHGSGSFGHAAARRYGTRQGVDSPAGWRGFAHVAAVAARLNRLVADALLEAGVPAWSLQPSASARCRGGELIALETAPIELALARGLVPLVYGDVALDETQGGTIISTEQILTFLAGRLHPACLLMVGQVDGVYDADPVREPDARLIPEITASNWDWVRGRLGGSHGPDVTGGMLAKVDALVTLARAHPGLAIRLLSGLEPGALESALTSPDWVGGGTSIRFEM